MRPSHSERERLNCAEMTAAHRTLAFGTRVRVCHSGCVTVRINDRGPWVRGRHIDLSPAAARAIGLSQTGRVTMTVDTLSGAPNTAAVANIDEQLPLSVTSSAMQDAVRKRNSLLLHDQKADFDTQEQKPDFTTRDAKLEDSLQEHLPDSMPRKRTSHVSNIYAYAEVLPDKKPADTVLEALEGIPVGTPIRADGMRFHDAAMSDQDRLNKASPSFSCEPSDRVGTPPMPLKGLRAPIAKLLLLLPQS